MLHKGSLVVVFAVLAAVASAQYGLNRRIYKVPFIPGNCATGPFGVVAAGDYFPAEIPHKPSGPDSSYANYMGCESTKFKSFATTDAQAYGSLAGSQSVSITSNLGTIAVSVDQCLPVAMLVPIHTVLVPAEAGPLILAIVNPQTDAVRMSCDAAGSCALKVFQDAACAVPKTTPAIGPEGSLPIYGNARRGASLSIPLPNGVASLVFSVKLHQKATLSTDRYKFAYNRAAYYADAACAADVLGYSLVPRQPLLESSSCPPVGTPKCQPFGQVYVKRSCVDTAAVMTKQDFDEIPKFFLPSNKTLVHVSVSPADLPLTVAPCSPEAVYAHFFFNPATAKADPGAAPSLEASLGQEQSIALSLMWGESSYRIGVSASAQYPRRKMVFSGPESSMASLGECNLVTADLAEFCGQNPSEPACVMGQPGPLPFGHFRVGMFNAPGKIRQKTCQQVVLNLHESISLQM